MRVTHDRDARAMYVKVSDKFGHRTTAVTPNVLMDYAEDGTLCGIELLGVDLEDITVRAAQAATTEAP